MKKSGCVLLAALLLCLGSAALADTTDQAVIDAFKGIWYCQGDNSHELRIWYQDGAFSLLDMRFSGDDVFAVEFEKCIYDAEKDALVCEGGELTYLNMGLEAEGGGSLSLWETWSSGFGATLTVDGETGLLRWSGSGDAVEDAVFEDWSFVDDGVFTGKWKCDGASATVTRQRDEYSVFIVMPLGENKNAYWEYAGYLDMDSGLILCTGDKIVIGRDENGGLAADEEYTAGRGVFYLYRGCLIWYDAMEYAGEGLMFARAAVQ